MDTLAVVQARMTSTRLPGKVLADVGGEPMLALLLHRLERATEIDRVIVATSRDTTDDPIAAFCAAREVGLYRGSLSDVLSRFVGASEGHEGAVVRITADCPLIDPGSVDEVVAALHESPSSVYASNVEPRTFPDGLDVEAFDVNALRQVEAEADDPAVREHVTLAIRADPERFARAEVVHVPNLGHLRWTVDTADDLAFVRLVAERLDARRYEAGLDEILDAVRRDPSLAAGGLRG